MLAKAVNITNYVTNSQLRLMHLRSLMQNTDITQSKDSLDAYIVPLWDPHFNDRLAPCHERLKFISGFSGSNGKAIVTTHYAFLWTDGRYHIQAGEQLENSWTLIKDGLPDTPSPGEYLNRIIQNGVIGIDPLLISIKEWSELSAVLKTVDNRLVRVERNLIDMIWEDRPKCPTGHQVFSLNLTFTGREVKDKLAQVRTTMRIEGASALVVSQLDEIAWLLNLRGRDLGYSAVFFSYLIILQESFLLFIDPGKLSPEISSTLRADGAELFNYHEVSGTLIILALQMSTIHGSKIWLGTWCNYALASLVPEHMRLLKVSPIMGIKAVKNSVEAEGMRQALLRDAVAIVRCLHWVESQLTNQQNLTELCIVNKLHDLKSEHPYYLSPSFETIAGFGSNAAKVHYIPTPESSKTVDTTALLLLDSGSVYLDGTTDATRTVHFGSPTDLQRDAYTRVLKGQIAIVTSKFPALLKPSRLDSFSRQALWDVGLDFNHGTGHGIGINVHEKPGSMRADDLFPEDTGFEANMFCSNEPGYYDDGEGAFGIRLENIIKVVNVTLENNFNGRWFLGFEDVTFLPYEHKLIKTELLTLQELQYLNEYQRRTREIVGSYIKRLDPKDPVIEWLQMETQPLIN